MQRSHGVFLSAVCIIATGLALPHAGTGGEREKKLAEKPGPQAVSERNRLRELSRVMHHRGQHDDSLAVARSALDLSRQIAGDPSDDLAHDLRWVVQLQMDTRDFVAAARTQQQVVKTWAKLRNKSEEKTARVYLRYIERIRQLTPDDLQRLRMSTTQLVSAERLAQLGRNREAAAAARQGLELRKEVLGYADREYAEKFVILGYYYLETGEDQRAQEVVEQGSELFRGLYGEHHRDFAAALNTLSLLSAKTGRHEDVVRLREQAASIYVETLGPENKNSRLSLEMLGAAWGKVAESRMAARKYQLAADAYRRAAEVYEKGFGPDDGRTRGARSLAGYMDKVSRLSNATWKRLAETADWITQAEALERDKKFIEAAALAAKSFQTLAEAVGPEIPEARSALQYQAKLLRQAGRAADAMAKYESLLEIERGSLGEKHLEYLQTLDVMIELASTQANGALETEEFAGALTGYRRALELRIRRHGNDHWKVRSASLKIEHVERLRAIGKAERDRVDASFDLMRQASDLIRQRRYTDAIAPASEALAIRESLFGENNAHTAGSCNALGYLKLELGSYVEAKTYLERARQARQKVLGSAHPDTGETWSQMGKLYSALNDHRRAAEAQRTAVSICERAYGKDEPEYARELVNLSTIYLQVKDVIEAEPLLRRAIDILQSQNGDRDAYARALNNLAAIYEVFETPLLAEELHGEAAAIWKEQGEIVGYALARDNLANAICRQGDFARAEPIQKEAVDLLSLQLTDRHRDTAVALGNLTHLYLAWGKRAEALPYAQRALVACRHNLDLAFGLQSSRQQLVALMHLRPAVDAALTLQSHDRDALAAAYGDVLNWKGVVFRRQYELRGLVHDNRAKPLFAELSQVSRNLSTMLLSGPGTMSRKAWHNRIDELTVQKDNIEAALATHSGPFRQARDSTVLSVRDLQRAVPEGVALVDFFEYAHVTPPAKDYRPVAEPKMVAFVIRKDQKIVAVPLGESQQIEKLVESWLKESRFRHRPTKDGPMADDAAKQLHALVWAPIEPYLKGCSTVVICPDGDLSRLPFAALPADDQGRYLIETRCIAVVPALQMLPKLLDSQPRQRDPSLLLVGAVDYDAALGPPSALAPADDRTVSRPRGSVVEAFSDISSNTGKEIDAIRATYVQHNPKAAVTVLRGNEASEETFRNRLSTCRWMHLATHGFFAPERVQSALAVQSADIFSRYRDDRTAVDAEDPELMVGVAFSGANRRDRKDDQDDGILTAVEIGGLDLSGMDLAVLSACETARGRTAGGEGVLGMHRALHVAGVRTVVASLWSVDDAATKTLMVAFYSNLGSGKLSKLEALRQAQLAMLERYDPVKSTLRGLEAVPPAARTGRVSPFYWAGFVLSGDWR